MLLIPWDLRASERERFMFDCWIAYAAQNPTQLLRANKAHFLQTPKSMLSRKDS